MQQWNEINNTTRYFLP